MLVRKELHGSGTRLWRISSLSLVVAQPFQAVFSVENKKRQTPVR